MIPSQKRQSGKQPGKILSGLAAHRGMRKLHPTLPGHAHRSTYTRTQRVGWGIHGAPILCRKSPEEFFVKPRLLSFGYYNTLPLAVLVKRGISQKKSRGIPPWPPPCCKVDIIQNTSPSILWTIQVFPQIPQVCPQVFPWKRLKFQGFSGTGGKTK